MQLVIRKSPIRLIMLFVGCLLFVAMGAWMAWGLPAPQVVQVAPNADRWARVFIAIIGWIAMALFGLAGVAILAILFDPRPRLVFDDEGVFDRSLRVGKIPWTDIRDAYIGTIHSTTFICLEVYDEAKYLDRFSKPARMAAAANRTLGFSPLCLNLAGLKVKAEDVLRIVLICKGEKFDSATPDAP
jgi:hypothetical protein